MKKKILEAIDRAVYNVMNTDIEDQNVDWNNDDINNEYVHAIGIDELYEKYKDNPCSVWERYDTKKAVSIIDDGGNEISLYEYKSGKTNPLFLKLSVSGRRDDIYIYVKENHGIIGGTQWYSIYYTDVCSHAVCMPDRDAAIKDMSGYINSVTLKENLLYDNPNIRIEMANAITLCENMKFGGFAGYLPAAGEIMFVYKYISLINYIFSSMHAPMIIFSITENFWTSTMNDSRKAWCFNMGYIHPYEVYEKRDILPLFKKIR